MFRTLRVRAGAPLNWRWHWSRLQADCEKLKLPAPDEAALLSEIARVAPGEAVVKATINVPLDSSRTQQLMVYRLLRANGVQVNRPPSYPGPTFIV